MTQKDDIPPCLISIDKEGRWFHKGAEMIHTEYIRLFYENMSLDDQGRYLIHWAGETCYVEVEDTAFVVRRVVFDSGGGGQASQFVLTLSDETEEALTPDTLYVGDENVLYCRVKEKRFPARFMRSAYYQLADHIIEKDGSFFLPLNKTTYPISEAD
ncbi:MAG: DUF1285 domain-containing protein [Deltaproteobacteria bacterium]|nr:DUF1285 domain-containing protein [Deltaproteobacteria bacterium]